MKKWQKLYFANGLINSIVSAIVFICCVTLLVIVGVDIFAAKSGEGLEGLALLFLIPLAIILSITAIITLIVGVYAVIILVQTKKGENSAYRYRKLLIVFATFTFIFSIACVIFGIKEGYFLIFAAIALTSLASGVYNIICYKEIKKSFAKSVDKTADIV